MNYIYHRVPKDMKGDILFPLNTLKETDPDLYKVKAGKYIGREKVMEQTLPVLNCLWNDVIHFTAVHPQAIKDALVESGDTTSYDLEFFEIDPYLLDPEQTIVYLYKHDNILNKFESANLAKFNPGDVTQYSLLPQETKDYYKQSFLEGKSPLLFHRVPHILYKGNLNISKCNKIKVTNVSVV